MRKYRKLVIEKWKDACGSKIFLTYLISGLLLVPALLVFTDFFFKYIENRPGGIILHDWVLAILPAKDVSIPIVLFEASAFILVMLRSTTDPTTFLKFLIAFIFILVSRIITIGFTQLRPPIGLIDLKDPFASMIYSSGFIDRDLFFSGHTAILFLLFLCSKKKADICYILFAFISVAFLLLIQHVHYTIDIIAAPFFALGSFWLAKRMMHFDEYEDKPVPTIFDRPGFYKPMGKSIRNSMD